MDDAPIRPAPPPLPTSSAAPISSPRSVALARVANGVKLIYLGSLIVVGGSILLGLLAGIVGALSRPGQVPDFPLSMLPFVAGLAGLIVLAGEVLGVVGNALCLATPQEAKAQNYIHVAVGATGLGVLISLSRWLFIVRPESQYVAALLSIVGTVALLLFLSELARFIGRADLSATAKSVLIWWIVSIIVVVAAGGLIALAIGLRPNMSRMEFQRAFQTADFGLPAALVSLLALALPLVTFVRYLLLLWKVRKTLLADSRIS